MNDLGDLDGDGEFDAIDMAILENGEENMTRKSNSGCCLMLFLLGSLFAAGLAIGEYFA